MSATRLTTDERQALFQELESLVASRGFEPGMATRMWDAWGDAEAEVDRLETINQTLREALTEARSWVALVSDQEPRFRTNLSLLVEQIDAALVAEGSEA